MTIKITFLPADIIIDAEPGEKITEVADRAGVDIPDLCGGNGACGSCKITIKEGNIGDPNDMEQMWGLEKGQRLGCQAVVGDTDLVIEV